MKNILIIGLFLLFSRGVYSCTCMNPSTYCETIQLHNSDLLLVGYKISDFYYGMKVKIVQVIDGLELRDTITVWGDIGFQCRHSSSSININDTIVFALHNCDLSGNVMGGNYEQTDHYQLSNCGVYFLNYSNGNITGSITNGFNILSLSNFIQTHTFCSSVTSIKKIASRIHLYPNPVKDNFYLNIDGYNGLIQTRIYAPTGRLLQNTNSTIISLKDYDKGIYLLKIVFEDREEALKLVKN